MTLPAITSVQVATVALPAYTARVAAIQASQGTSNPLPEINFSEATILVGDGNGAIPSISTLQSTGALVHQVWSGNIVQSVSVDSVNSSQIDILCVIPAVDGSGAEIGPFWVTEFIITDENAVPMIAGVTLMPKLVTANGAATDLSFIGAVAFAPGTVDMAAPSASFLTTSEAAGAISGLLSAANPLVLTDTVQSNGWTAWALSVLSATMAQIGVGRPATDAEFAAGAAAAAPAYQFPWPTLAQVTTTLAAVIALIPGAATVAQAIAGVAANVWISPAALVGAFSTATLGSALLSALQAALGLIYPGGAGWQTLPGGIIIQWTQVSFNSSSTGPFTFTFPVAFPTAFVLGVATDTGWSGGTNFYKYAIERGTASLSTGQIFCSGTGGWVADVILIGK